ncbi:hypothetical protein lerEdw1_010304 [Lerista edwardsae]|nr:hypothetical protein lerEdw1_010304 [Lerista edwardsae]
MEEQIQRRLETLRQWRAALEESKENGEKASQELLETGSIWDSIEKEQPPQPEEGLADLKERLNRVALRNITVTKTLQRFKGMIAVELKKVLRLYAKKLPDDSIAPELEDEETSEHDHLYTWERKTRKNKKERVREADHRLVYQEAIRRIFSNQLGVKPAPSEEAASLTPRGLHDHGAGEQENVPTISRVMFGLITGSEAAHFWNGQLGSQQLPAAPVVMLWAKLVASEVVTLALSVLEVIVVIYHYHKYFWSSQENGSPRSGWEEGFRESEPIISAAVEDSNTADAFTEKGETLNGNKKVNADELLLLEQWVDFNLEENKAEGAQSNSRVRNSITWILLVLFIIQIAGLVTTIFVFTMAKPDIPAAASATPCCPHGWIMNEGHCYAISELEGTWAAGQHHCAALGASLAVVDSLEKLNAAVPHKDPFNHWVGLLREPGLVWKWPDGTLFNNLYEVEGDGQCAYLSEGILRSADCLVAKKWLCSQKVKTMEGSSSHCKEA